MRGNNSTNRQKLVDAIFDKSFELNVLLDKAHGQNLYIEVHPVCVVMPPRDPKKLKITPVIVRYKGCTEEKKIFNCNN